MRNEGAIKETDLKLEMRRDDTFCMEEEAETEVLYCD